MTGKRWIILGGSVVVIFAAVLLFKSCLYGTCNDFIPVSQLEGPVQQEWMAHYHTGEYGEGPQSISVDNYGDIYVTGPSRTIKYNSAGDELWVLSASGDSKTIDTEGNLYVAGLGGGESVVKYGADGKELWASHHTDSTYNINSYGVITLDRQGNVYVAVNVGDSSNSTVRIAKYNGITGDELWMIGHESSGISSMVVDRSDNLYVVGANHLTKYNSDGAELWDIILDEWYGDVVRSLALDSQGNVIVTKDYHILKYSPSGELMWRRDGYDYLLNIAVDGSGNIYSLDSLGPHELEQAKIKKCSSSGTIQWSNGVSGGIGLAVDSAGSVYVVRGGNGCIINKYNTGGTIVWRASYSGGGSNYLFEPAYFAVDASYNVYVTLQSVYKECGVNGLLYIDSGGTRYTEYTTIKYSQTDGPPLPIPTPITHPPCTLTIYASAGGFTFPSGGTYQYGILVDLRSFTSPGYVFDFWSGDASGTSPNIEVSMTSNKTIYAHFREQ